MRTRTFKICYCRKCDGRKLVDLRTKEEHESKYVRINFDINNYQEAGPSDTGPSDTVPDTRPSADAFDNNFDVEMEYEPLLMITDPSSERNYCYLIKKLPVYKSAKVKKEKYQILFLIIYYQIMIVMMMITMMIMIVLRMMMILKTMMILKILRMMIILRMMMRRRSISLQQILIMMNQNFLILTLIIIIHGLYCGYYNINNDINFPMLQ